MTPSLSESKVKPIFCFPVKIPDDPTATNRYIGFVAQLAMQVSLKPEILLSSSVAEDHYSLPFRELHLSI